jgi:hypothetical protein
MVILNRSFLLSTLFFEHLIVFISVFGPIIKEITVKVKVKVHPVTDR